MAAGDSIFGRAATLLSRIATEHTGRSVVYRTPAGATCALQATPTELERVLFDRNGVDYTVRTREYLLNLDDLFVAGVLHEPAEGDTIEDEGKTYRVARVGGDPPWRLSHPHSRMARVATEGVQDR